MGISIALTKLKEEFVASLGGGPVVGDEVAVTVELTEAQFKSAVQMAKRWYVAKKGYVVYRPIQLAKSVTEYQMADDIWKVLDVIFDIPSDVAAFYSFGFFDIIPIGPQNTAMYTKTMANYSGFAELLQFNEQRKRIFSSEPDWTYNDSTKTLFIHERRGMNDGIGILKVKLNDVDIDKLDGRDADMVYRYIKAKCKEIVGRVRSKYDSMPAAGGSVTMDGKDLIAEAKEELLELDKDIWGSQGPDMMVVG